MRRLILAATVAAFLIAGLLPATVAAAPALTFGTAYSQLMIRSNCISGMGPADAPIHVVWKRANGDIKAIVDVTSGASGKWEYCSASRVLAVGDTIRASTGSYARTFTMSNISLSANRDTGAFRGRGLPGATGDLWFMAGIFADYSESAQVTADSQGRWFQPEVDGSGASGGIEAEVSWTTPQGDHLAARMMVPFVAVTIGRPFVGGGSQAFSTAVVNLHDPVTNDLRGRATTTSDGWGSFEGRFLNSAGNPVSARVGDRVVSPLASSIDWHVPNIEGSAGVASDIVEGRCYSTEIVPIFAIVQVFRTGQQRGWAYVGLDEFGAFEIDMWRQPGFFFNPANIKHGDRVVINCYYGPIADEEVDDVVSFPFLVP